MRSGTSYIHIYIHVYIYIYIYIHIWCNNSFYAIKTIRHGDGLCYLFILRSGRSAGVKQSIDFGFKRHPLLSPRQLTRYAHLRSLARVFPLLVQVRAAKLTRRYLFRDPVWRGLWWLWGIVSRSNKSFRGWFHLVESMNRKVR